MGNILCGGNEANAQFSEKRKRFSARLIFRLKPKPRVDLPGASSSIPKSSPSPPAHAVVVDIPAALAAPEAIRPADPAAAAAAPAAPPGPVALAAVAAAAAAPVVDPALLPAPAPAVAVVPAAAAAATAAAGAAAGFVMNGRPAPGVEKNGGAPAVVIDLDNFENDVKSACTAAVLALFPDICPDFLQEKSQQLAYDYESIVSHILDQADNGAHYPRRPTLKRKRHSSNASRLSLRGAASAQAGSKASGSGGGADSGEGDRVEDEDKEDDDEERKAVEKFGAAGRRQMPKSSVYLQISRTLFQQAFVYVPHKQIVSILAKNENCLLPAILDLDTQIATKSPAELPFQLKKTKTKQLAEYTVERLPGTIQCAVAPGKKEALEEYQTALMIRQIRKAKRDAQRQQEWDEAENFRQAQLDGTVKDCECCYGDFAMNRMVHCDGVMLHWFCKDCARRNAETQIGLSKYTLSCMSMDSCKAGFSYEEQNLFLDAKTRVALERIEQEHILRVAGIENLETCPFCPYAAEYPPVEVNKEFRCRNPDCEEVSCRLCRKETHIPKTCEEVERENGPSARLTIEEAMSLALIRKCNKCNTPFIKELGCNKMMCTRAGCGNVQCYVCSVSCDYSHFDDASRGGKKGNCPLFDSVEKRHEDEVRAAEEAARRQVTAKNPALDVNLLKINVSAKVLEDEKQRRDAEQKRQNIRV
ncbi:ring finger protein [Niveomyces insectorum RCEF 264]|uniref:Ring finger protein n=1 Tax=Niveomyces insectorum RCEF 264 TaxID=1081102 RepID=A0A167PVK1_9HYPO|nr:ring finger protein [Niveomyces insectorum RCEF 264]